MSKFLPELLDLRIDQADPDVIDTQIRDNAKVVGTNLWVLFFAILVASVGLNVNSTAVVIGAMLISPLMGPIVGIGYGLGINDISLIKLALRNLAVFTVISLIASTLYFTISPLDIAQSELSSRTMPTMWDVLIAFFGGSAGIIATTRKSVSNVIPGVAIATALMPPLCTAGFGLSQGNWAYFGGAFFLYSINSVFIALATFLFVNLCHLPKRNYFDRKTEKRTNFLIGITVLLMVIPSTYLAYNLVQQSRFSQAADQYIQLSAINNDFILLDKNIDATKQSVSLTIGSSTSANKIKTAFEKQLKQKGFDKADVTVRSSGTSTSDLSNLKTKLTQELYTNMIKQVEGLNKENQKLQKQLGQVSQLQLEDQQLFTELSAQYPQVNSASISRGKLFLKEIKAKALIKIEIGSDNPLNENDKKRIANWLAVKYKKETVQIDYKITAEIITQ